ncbi:hypothetical protein REPUB_Repub11eG0144800 [Reevesia pubescens]
MSLPGEGNPKELTQQVNSIDENLIADQHLNSPALYAELEADFLTQCEDSSWASILSAISLPGQGNPNEFTQQLNSIVNNLTADQQLNPQPELGMEPDSMAQTEDLSVNYKLSVTSPLWYPNELPHLVNSHDQQLNSQRDAEEGVGCFEANRSHLDHEEGPFDQASNGKIQRGRIPRVTLEEKAKNQLDHAGASAEGCIGQKRRARGPIILTEEQERERRLKKRVADRKYREDIKTELYELRSIKPQYDRLMKIASNFGGIDQMESQINRMSSDKMESQINDLNSEKMESRINHHKSELLRLQEKELEYDMFRQVIETEFNRLGQMKSNNGVIQEMKSIMEKLKKLEAESHRLELLKSKYGDIEEMESMLDKFKELEAESHRLELLKSKYGDIEEMESMLDKFKELEAESGQLNQKKSKFEGIQEIESILDKFKQMDAELHKFDQIKLLFGEIVLQINRLKLQLEKHKQMLHQKELESFEASPGSLQQMEIDKCFGLQDEEADFCRFEQKELPFFPESPGSLQEHRGSQSLDLNCDSNMSGISLNSSAVVSGILPVMQYSDVLVDELIAKLIDENVVSNLDLKSFKDLLDGECESVGKYIIPQSLVSTARDIFKAHGDITKKSKYSGITVQTIFVLCCAAIKEMGDRSLEEVTEKIMWKWRDAIMDAKRSECDVEFVIEHLKTIAQGYFGLKARNDLDGLKQRIASLRACEEALRKELEMKSNEIKIMEAKQGDLTSKQCKICLESADKFLGKPVGIF